MDERCAQKTLVPWAVGIAVLVCTTIILAFSYYDEAQQLRREGRKLLVTPAVFVPPWHGEQNPDAVTGASPKAVAFNLAIERVSPSVVGINTSGAQSQSGSGIIVHRQGYVLTNHHVVNGATNIVVTLAYGQLVKSYSAELVQGRPELDLAVIQITSTGKEAFSPAPLGDSDRIYIGQPVAVIGSPFGLAQSASAGIISNTQRTLTAGNRVFEGLIQTDASINPGSSGGALITVQGEVIGVNIAIYSPVDGFTGVGFAVPINQAKRAFPGLIEGTQLPRFGGNAGAAGSVRQVEFPVMGDDLQMIAARGGMMRPWLGIDVYPLDRARVRAFNVPFRWGVLVNRGFDNSVAAKAGLQRGDVIYRINNRRVKDIDMLWSYLADSKVGDKVKITVFRNSSRKAFVVTLEPEPPNVRSLLSKVPRGGAAGETGRFGIEEISWLGIDIQPVESGEALQEFGIDPSESGVLVGEVEGIAAIDAGLKPGDLIKKVNTYEIKDIRTFKEVIRKVDPSSGVVLDIIRQGRPFYITVYSAGQDLGAWQ